MPDASNKQMNMRHALFLHATPALYFGDQPLKAVLLAVFY